MQDREKVRQAVLLLGAYGKEFTIDDVLNIEGVIGQETEQDHDILKKARARSYARFIYSNEGLKLRSTSKNRYKVIDENDVKERVFEEKRKEKKLQKAWHEYKQYQAFRLEKGDSIQMEMVATEMLQILEGGDSIAQNTSQNTVVATVRTSTKSKKASGQ